MNIGSRDTCRCDRRQGSRTLLDVPKAAHVWVTATRFAWSFDRAQFEPPRCSLSMSRRTLSCTVFDAALCAPWATWQGCRLLPGSCSQRCMRYPVIGSGAGCRDDQPRISEDNCIGVAAAGPAAGGDIPGLPDRLHIGVAAPVLTSLELHQYMRFCTLYCRSGAAVAFLRGLTGAMAASLRLGTRRTRGTPFTVQSWLGETTLHSPCYAGVATAQWGSCGG